MQIMILHRSSFYTSIKAILKRLGIRSSKNNDSYEIRVKIYYNSILNSLRKKGK